MNSPSWVHLPSHDAPSAQQLDTPFSAIVQTAQVLPIASMAAFVSMYAAAVLCVPGGPRGCSDVEEFLPPGDETATPKPTRESIARGRACLPFLAAAVPWCYVRQICSDARGVGWFCVGGLGL